MGRLELVREQIPDAPEPHGFDQVSRVARADRNLSDRGFRLLSAIEGFCWGDDRECWPCNKTLGRHCGGVSADTIRRGLAELVRLGYIRIEPDKTKMRGQRLILNYVLKRPDPYP
jgi:hypothetical protein